MKLTDVLKNKVENVDTKEETKKIIGNADMELSDEELEVVAGGQYYYDTQSYRYPDQPKPE